MGLILMELENSTEKVWFLGECIKDIIKSKSNSDIKQSSEEEDRYPTSTLTVGVERKRCYQADK